MASDAAGIRHALTAAQLVTVLSPQESSALDKAVMLVEDMAAMGVPAGIVLAGMPPGQDFWDAKTFALRRRGLLVPAAFHRDEAIERAMSVGQTAIEIDADGKAAPHIARLWSLMRQMLAEPATGPAMSLKKPWSRATHVIAVVAPPGPMRAGIAAHLAVRGGMGDDGGISAMLVSTAMDGPLTEWIAKRKGKPPPLKIAAAGEIAALREWAAELGCRLCVIEISSEELRDDAELRDTVDQVVVPVLVPLATRMRMTDREFWPHREIYMIMRGNDKPADVIKAKRALEEKGCALVGTVSLGKDLAQTFGEGSTAMESRPESRAARDIVELWASLRKLLRD
jgi:hypothetical protein